MSDTKIPLPAVRAKTELEHGGRCGVRSPWHSGCIRFADECDGITHWDIAGQPEHIWTTPQVASTSAPTLQIHTAGELHLLTSPPPITERVTFSYSLSDLLDDPAHKPDARLTELDGTDDRVQDFVFATEGALELYWSMVHQIEYQLRRGKSVVVLLLCRGGRHRSVSFAENLAVYFDITATHHHRTLPVVPKVDPAVAEFVEKTLPDYSVVTDPKRFEAKLKSIGVETEEQFFALLRKLVEL